VAFAQLFAGLFVLLLWGFVLARILLTWTDPGQKTRAWRVILPMTEPLLAPLRRRLPRTGAFDAAMVLWLVVLGLIWRLLL
jgi:YggT family protein